MFCRYCGKTIAPDAERCEYCGKHQWKDEQTDSGSGFMQAPSLEDDFSESNAPTPVEPVAVESPRKQQSDSVYPPRQSPMQQAEDLSDAFQPSLQSRSNYRQEPQEFKPPVMPEEQEVIGYKPPVLTPESEEEEPVYNKYKKKKKKKAGVFGVVIFLIIVLLVGWYFSVHSRFDLRWEQDERDVASIVTGKLDGTKAESAEGAYIVSEDIASRYYTLDNFENVGKTQLICHFENKKLSGAELYSENTEQLVQYICDLFDIDREVVQTQAQLEYDGTYVVIKIEDNGARAMFADTTYGGACSIDLEYFFGL